MYVRLCLWWSPWPEKVTFYMYQMYWLSLTLPSEIILAWFLSLFLNISAVMYLALQLFVSMLGLLYLLWEADTRLGLRRRQGRREGGVQAQ